MSRWTERAYLAGGVAGLALVAVAFLLAHDDVSAFGTMLYGAGALVIAAWMIEGLAYHHRRKLAEAEAERQRAAQERAAQQEREAEEAARRVAQEIYAQRRVSHGGMTIKVHKRASAGASAAEDAGAGTVAGREQESGTHEV